MFIHAPIECPARLLPLVIPSIPLDWDRILTQQLHASRLQVTHQSASKIRHLRKKQEKKIGEGTYVHLHIPRHINSVSIYHQDACSVTFYV